MYFHNFPLKKVGVLHITKTWVLFIQGWFVLSPWVKGIHDGPRPFPRGDNDNDDNIGDNGQILIRKAHLSLRLRWDKSESRRGYFFVCLFGIYRPTREFSLTRRRHHYWWRAANFNLCSALIAIEQWGFFSVQHLLWHKASVYNCHFWGPVTLTPCQSCIMLILYYFNLCNDLRFVYVDMKHKGILQSYGKATN